MSCPLRCHAGEIESNGRFVPCGECDLGRLITELAKPHPDRILVTDYMLALRGETFDRALAGYRAIANHCFGPARPALAPVTTDGAGAFPTKEA